MEKQRKSDEALRPDTVVRSTKYEYRVVSVLGRGGFGITYKVERRSDGMTFAMKEYFPSTLCERDGGDSMSYLKTNSDTIETGMNDFVTEANRLVSQKINHPNTISIGEVFKANNTAYYIMEFIDGCNLYQYVKRSGGKPLTVPQALSVMRPVLQVVSILHSHKLTHLDIKHENILLTWEDDGSLRPVLIDFGQSKHYDKRGKATSALTNAGCSEGFAPPEQYMGLSTFTPQADVYALAATTLYLLTAVQPDKEMSASDITGRLDKADPDGTKIPQRIRNAIVNGMRKDKDDRTQSVAELATELGLEISSHSHEGNVTRLLNLDIRKRPKMPKINWTGMIRPTAAAIGVAALVGIIIWFANRPGPTPSDQLSEAIENHDYERLRYFAELDSTRAFIPYAYQLVDSMEYDKAYEYASKMLGTAYNDIARHLLLSIDSLRNEQSPVADTTILNVNNNGINTDSPNNVQGPNDKDSKEENIKNNEDEIFVAVEEQAEFPGGTEALMRWLGNNIHYPEYAQENEIEGRVVVKFIVEKDGSIGQASIISGTDKHLNAEAIRLVKGMPKWKPGKQSGVAVRTYFTLPISFKLDHNLQ